MADWLKLKILDNEEKTLKHCRVFLDEHDISDQLQWINIEMGVGMVNTVQMQFVAHV